MNYLIMFIGLFFIIATSPFIYFVLIISNLIKILYYQSKIKNDYPRCIDYKN